MNKKYAYIALIILVPIAIFTWIWKSENSAQLIVDESTTCEFSKCPERIDYKNSSANLVHVELPFPGAVVGKEFSVIGKARGTWYFEASFPIVVLDAKGQVLVETHAEAQSDWMTENFVPFIAKIKVPESYIGPAKLILKKDNPSGLPDYDASISFEIVIEY